MVKSPVFHIGYHKTATSFLQRSIFEKYPKNFQRVAQRKIFENIIYPDPLDFDEKNARSFVDHHIKIANQKKVIPIFSNERLSGGLHFGGFDSVEIAKRIKLCVPDARIIIGIREQEDMILSVYGQYIRAVGSCSINEYLEPSTLKNKSLFHFSFLEYHRLIELYQNLFNKGNVLVIPYELLRKSPEDYLLRIFKFLECEYLLADTISRRNLKVNESLKPSVISIKRFFNPFIIKGHPFIGQTLYSTLLVILFKIISNIMRRLPTRWLDKNVSTKRENRIRSIVQNYYRLSNQKTQRLIDLNLKNLGYLQ